MYDVRISDGLYEQASQAARANHVSVEAFVEKAVQKSLQEDQDSPIRLTNKQATLIAKAESDIDAGKFLTAEQMRGYFNKKQAACPPTSSR